MEYFDFPEVKVDIFEPNVKNYFLKSSKFTYLCSYEEMMRVDRWKDFSGAFVLVIYKRYAIIKDGRIIYQNAGFEDGNRAKGRYGENGFVIISDTLHQHHIQDAIYYGSHMLLNEHHATIVYKSAETAVNAAIELSKLNQETYMVAQWFDEEDRH